MRRERRQHARRAKSIRLRFEADGEEHRAVTATVSPTGAFVKAAYVPPAGTTITFREVYNHGARIQLRGEVSWVLAEASLVQPDTGFGLRLIEVFTQDDPAALEEFLRYFDPDLPAPLDIQFEERPSGVCAVYRFDERAGNEPPGSSSRPNEESENGELEELATVDLSSELARLDREQARRAPTTAPKVESPPPSDEATPKDAPPPKPRDRSRRRMVTGIFTALFSRRREQADEGFGPDRQSTPPIDERPTRAVHDARLPRVTLLWDGGTLDAGVKTVGGELAVLRARGAGPPVEADVILSPVDGGDAVSGLELGGRVLSFAAGAGDRGDEYTLLLDPPDGPTQAERLTAWLVHVNGPAVDR